MNHLIRAGGLLALVLLLAACGGSEERAADYLQRAQSSFDAGDYVKAELDAKNVIQIEPNNIDAILLLADIQEKQEKLRAHFQTLLRAAELDPTNAQTQIRIGRLYLTGRSPEMLERAAEAANRALELSPDDPEALVLHAMVTARGGDFEGGRVEVQAVLAEHPRNINALTFMAATYRDTDPDRAIEILDQAIEVEPDNQGLYGVKVSLLSQLGRLPLAEDTLKEMIKRFPDNNNNSYVLARFLVASGREDEAESVLKAVVDADSDDMTAKLIYSKFLALEGPERAINVLQGYIKDAPDVFPYRFALGQAYVQAEQFEEARKVFLDIIERDGLKVNGLEARTKLAALALKEGKNDEGRDYIAQVLAEDAGNPEALTMRATLALVGGDTRDAIADLRSVTRANPNAEAALLLLGKAHLQAGETSLAMENFQKLLESHPTNVEGRRSLAELMIQARRWEDVRSILELGVRQSPSDLRMARLHIDTLLQLEDWDAADAEADRVLELIPDQALGYYIKGRIDQLRQDYEASIPHFQKALEINPNAVETITSVVRSYVSLDETEGAIRFLNDFTKRHPDHVHGITLTGEMHARLGNWDEAILLNEQAIDLDANWMPAYRNLIGIQLRLNGLEEADKVVQRGLRVSEGNSELMLLRATIFERSERFNEAIAIYELELEKNPALDIAANNYIALVADHQTDEASLAKALSYAERFQDTDNPIFLDTVGWLYYRLNEIEKALPLLEQAVAQASQLSQLRYHLGMVYFKLDRLNAARRELEAATKDPASSFTGVEEARETLRLL